MRTSMNKVIAGRNWTGKHLTKDVSFDILSLADQLYRSKSSHPDGPERGKVYFSENQAPDLMKQGKTHLHTNILSYNEAINQHALSIPISEQELALFNEKIEIRKLEGQNESVDEQFSLARAEASVTSDLPELYM